MKKTFSHWAPTVLCVLLSLLSLVRSVNADTNSWQPVFFAFLPMCFALVSIVTISLGRRIEELQREVADLRAR